MSERAEAVRAYLDRMAESLDLSERIATSLAEGGPFLVRLNPEDGATFVRVIPPEDYFASAEDPETTQGGRLPATR